MSIVPQIRIVIATMCLTQGLWAAIPVPEVATNEPEVVRNLRVIPPVSAKVDTAQEAANKLVVLRWHYEFFDLGQFESASNKYMAEDFQQNDPREPSGRGKYVNEFKKNGYVAKPPAERPPLLAVFAEGDLVMTVIPEGWSAKSTGRVDAGPIHCNMYRVVNGRIKAMWVSGGGGAPPTAAAVPSTAK
jgi:predicted SnoaL-like aldol condensation-catalyzing enzyme